MKAKQNPEYLQKLNALEVALLKDNVLLTRQELKVLYATIEGKTNDEIAEELGRNLCTIKTHKTNLISKLNLKGRKEFQKYVLKMIASHTLDGEKST
jgi:DNA-binding NarL/FixJ family response regulator